MSIGLSSIGELSIGDIPAATGPATAITLSGPSGGVVNVASMNFTAGADGTITGTVRFTPTDSSGHGSFSPTFVDLSSGSPTGTFTYTPTTTGARNINGTNNGGLNAPASVVYTASNGALTLSGPSSGTVNVASTDFTVGCTDTIVGTVTVTPTDSSGAGSFLPASVQISAGSPTATFTYTPTTRGARNINATNNGSLDAPANIAYTSNAAGTITLTDLTDLRVYQRIGTTATITLAGSYTGTPQTLQARLVFDGTSVPVAGCDWQTAVASPSAGTFSAAFPTAVPQGAWYNAQVRFSNDVAAVSNGSSRVGVGLLVCTAGQSLMGTNYFYGLGSGNTPDLYTSTFSNAGGWTVIPSIANGATNFVNKLRLALGGTIPVAMINTAVPGSSMDVLGDQGNGYWMNTAGGSPYALWQTAITAVGGALESILWDQGQNDGTEQYVVDFPNLYGSDLATVFGRFRSYTGQANLPIVITALDRYAFGGTPVAGAWTLVRDTQMAAVGGNNYGPISIFWATTPDGLHPDATDYIKYGTQQELCVANFLGLSTVPYRGPSIIGFTAPDTTHTVVYLLQRGGTDFTPTTAIGNFLIDDNGANRVISAAVRTSGTKITLTHAAVTGGARIVRYCYEYTIVPTTVVLDNSANQLPLEATTAAGAALLTVPGKPTGVTATAGNASAVVAFTAPSDGGIAITRYTATSTPDGITGFVDQAGSGTIIVNGLPDDEDYTFTVHATNPVGDGPESDPSNVVTPTAPIVRTRQSGYDERAARLRLIQRDDEEILAIVAAVVRTLQ